VQECGACNSGVWQAHILWNSFASSKKYKDETGGIMPAGQNLIKHSVHIKIYVK
jgi:hypothetical protein